MELTDFEVPLVILIYILFGYVCGRMHQYGIMRKKENKDGT